MTERSERDQWALGGDEVQAAPLARVLCMFRLCPDPLHLFMTGKELKDGHKELLICQFFLVIVRPMTQGIDTLAFRRAGLNGS